MNWARKIPGPLSPGWAFTLASALPDAALSLEVVLARAVVLMTLVLGCLLSDNGYRTSDIGRRTSLNFLQAVIPALRPLPLPRVGGTAGASKVWERDTFTHRPVLADFSDESMTS